MLAAGRLDAAEAERNEILAKVPNPPDPSAPDGGEDDAVEIRRVGDAGPGSGKEHTEVGRFVTIVEPALLVMMGIVIATVVLALYMPLFQLSSVIGVA